MTPVVCAASMASAFNVVLNLSLHLALAYCRGGFCARSGSAKDSAQTFRLFKHRGLSLRLAIRRYAPRPSWRGE